nr:TonB-dependent receptor [Bacteroidota bacterium]
IALQLGGRFDNIQPTSPFGSKMDMVVTPRANLSVELFDNFNLRAGYGVAAKAPTLLYLYPTAGYYDLLNFNYYPTNPAERLVLITTKKFDLRNRDLKIMTNTKKEIGFDWTLDNKRLTVTGFHEKTKNGYDFSTILNSVTMVPLPKFQVLNYNPGMPPTLDPVPASIDTFVADYLMPNNNRVNVNKGVEFDLDLGRFDAIRTSFVFTGAWINSKSVNNDYYVVKRQVAGKDPTRVAIYEKGRGDVNERITSTLRMIHNIPELRFIVTFSAQTIWDQSNVKVGHDSIPVGYIRRDNSQIVWLNDAQKQNITSSDQELFTTISPQTYIKESWPPLWLFYIRLTKEISKNIGFSFYANNVFSHRPLVESTRYKNQFERRNPSLFFGTEINIKL